MSAAATSRVSYPLALAVSGAVRLVAVRLFLLISIISVGLFEPIRCG